MSTATAAPVQSPVVGKLLQEVERIRPVIERNREANEANRRLSDEVYDAMLGAGLFRMTAPAAFGGLELHPAEAYQVFFAVAKIDTAAGWNLQIAGAAAGFSAFLPAAGGEEVFAKGPDVISAGGFFPPAAATRVSGGWRITGRTPFASGCDRADWLLMPAIEFVDGAPKLDPATGQPTGMVSFLPKSDVQVIDTWHTLGMRGTGSNDVAVNDAFVPGHRVGVVAPLTSPPPAYAGPSFRLFPFTGIHGEAIPSLAAAESAIDALADLARTKTPAMYTVPLAERELAQHHLGKARGLIGAAKTYLTTSITEAYDTVAREGKMSDRDKMECQLAGCFAAEAAAQAIDLVHEAAGTSGIRLEQPFERHFRDIHTLTQHTSKSVNRYTSVGKMELGQPLDWFALQL